MSNNPVSRGGNDFLTTNTYGKSQISYSNTQSKRYDPSSKKGIVGLNNIGNTCFMNATLQCMLNCPGFADTMETESHYGTPNKYGLARSFSDLVKNVRGGRIMKDISPRDVKSAASLKSRIFGGYAQQDAHEFLVHFLEGVSMDMNRVKGKPKYIEMDYRENKTSLENVIISHLVQRMVRVL